jgi:hypothetical protein
MRYKSKPDEVYGLREDWIVDLETREFTNRNIILHHAIFKDINVLMDYFIKDGWVFKGDKASKIEDGKRIDAHIVHFWYDDTEL